MGRYDVRMFGLRDVRKFTMEPREYDSLTIMRKDKYDFETLIAVRQGINATLFRLNPVEPPIPFVESLALTDQGSGAGHEESQVFRYIVDVAQYNNSKFAISEFYPDRCVREFDSKTSQITKLIGSCDRRLFVSELAEVTTVQADQFNVGSPTALLILEKSMQLIMIDSAYNLTYLYRFENKTLELFLPSQNIGEPLSLLTACDESIVYISHTCAVTTVSMTDRELRQLIITLWFCLIYLRKPLIPSAKV